MSAERAGDDLDQDDDDERREVEPAQWRQDPPYGPEHRLGDLVEEAVDTCHRRAWRDGEPAEYDSAENQNQVQIEKVADEGHASGAIQAALLQAPLLLRRHLDVGRRQ